MPNPVFGVGMLSITTVTGSTPTPVQVGVLQNVTLDIETAAVELWGANRFPVDVAMGKTSIKGKAQSGTLGSGTVAAILNGTSTTGRKIGIADESAQVAANAYTATNGGTYFEDLGVINTVTGLAMTRGATATGAGVYAVNTTTGVYAFNAADSNPLCKVSYSYTSSGTGKYVPITNGLMGGSYAFKLNLFNTYKTKYFGVSLWSVQIPKLSLGLKNDAFTMQDIEFVAYADSTGRVIDSYFED